MDIRIAPDVSVQAASAVTSTPAPALTPIPPPPAIANISPFGDLMGKLRELSHVSPAAFRDVTAQLRDVLHSASAQAPSHEASAIGDLAARFDAASQTGTLASLQGAQGATSIRPRAPDLPVVAQLVQHVDAALQEVSPAH